MKPAGLFFFVLFVIFVLVSAQAYAFTRTLTVLQQLNFGVFGVRNNDAQYDITVDANNNTTCDTNGFVCDTDAVRGVFDIDNLTPFTALTISAANGTLSLNGMGNPPLFTIRDFTHNSPVTDGNGDATLHLGATLRSSGTGQYYQTGSYQGTFDLDVDW